MAQTKLTWGVIGTSNIGRAAVNPAIQASHNGELLAVASRNGEAAREFAAKSGIRTFYGSYDALLDDDRIDAVYIPLPNSLHHEWTIKAAEKGKHVLCEKPLALNAAECGEMQRAAQDHGVRLMEAFMYRFHPQTEKVLEMIRNGAVGDLKFIRSGFTFRVTSLDNIRLKPELGGGSLMDVGCYCVNLSRTIAGQEPVEVQALARWGASGVDEQLVGTLRFPNDVLAQFDCGLATDRREAYEVAGTEASLNVPVAFLPGTQDTLIHEHHGRSEVKTHKIGGMDEYRLMVEHFADCVLNEQPFRYPATEACANMRVIQALYESASGGGNVVTLQS